MNATHSMPVTGSLYKPLPLATIIKNYCCGMVTQAWQAEARNMKNYRHICPTDFKVRTLNYTAQLNNCMKIYYRYKRGRKMGWKNTGWHKKWELLKCVVAAMYSWLHCGRGTLSYRQPRHSVIMDQWNGQQRAFIIKMFYKNNDSLEGAQEFRHFLNLGRHGRVPSKHAIKTWIKNFEETGSALKKKPTGRPRSARTPQNIVAVRVSV